MSSYVPRELTPIYILLWRLTLTYFTLGFGFVVFSGWLRQGLKSIDQDALAEPERAGQWRRHDGRAGRPRARLRRRTPAAPAGLPPTLPLARRRGAVLLLLVQSGLALVGPRLTEHALDVAIPHGDLGLLSLLAGLYLATLLFEFVVEYGGTLLTTLVGQRVMYDLRMEIFGQLQRLSITFFDRNPVGRLMTRVTSDVETLNELFSSGVVTLFGDVFTLVAIMGMMLVDRLAARAGDLLR